MLIVIALVAILVALAVAALNRLRGAGQQTTSLATLAQLSRAYVSYAEDNEFVLMPGYLDEDTNADLNLGITVRLKDGTLLDQCNANGICDASSYVWRLAPWMDHNWFAMYADLANDAVTSRLEEEYQRGVFGPGTAQPGDIGISHRPAYGLNSIFLGGDSAHGDAATLALNPWNASPGQSIAATRMSQVKNPARLIVFAPASKADPGAAVPGQPYEPLNTELTFAGTSLGFSQITPPYTILNGDTWENAQWTFDASGVAKTANGDYGGEGAGLPIIRTRAKDTIPVGHLDGSATLEQLSELAFDMTRWSPFEVARRATNPGG
jgi:hypothetical protein